MSDYNPTRARVGQATPQTNPDAFDVEDLRKEVAHLRRINKRQGNHPLRQVAIDKLETVIASRWTTTVELV